MRTCIPRVVALLMGLALVAGAATPAVATDILVHFTNKTDSVLYRSGGQLDGGCWVHEPPLQIEIDQTVDMASTTCGILTGTEFHVRYKLDNGREISMHYDNPAVGSDTFEENGTEGYAFTK